MFNLSGKIHLLDMRNTCRIYLSVPQIPLSLLMPKGLGCCWWNRRPSGQMGETNTEMFNNAFYSKLLKSFVHANIWVAVLRPVHYPTPSVSLYHKNVILSSALFFLIMKSDHSKCSKWACGLLRAQGLKGHFGLYWYIRKEKRYTCNCITRHPPVIPLYANIFK